MPKIRTSDSGNNYLHAYDSGHDFRVVALANNAQTAQNWTITDLGNGRYTLHQVIGGVNHYLTAEANYGTHVFVAPKSPSFNRQIWRKDQGSTTNLISLAKSGRFLQADVDGLILIQPDFPSGPRGFDVELVKGANLGNGSHWTPGLA
jgi:hypothetical protein